MHGGVVVEMVVDGIRGVIDVLMDFIFTHFLTFLFGEAVIIVIFVSGLVRVLVEMCIAGVGVDGVCMSKSGKVGGGGAGLVRMLGAGAISHRVVATTVGALDRGTFRVEDGNLGVL